MNFSLRFPAHFSQRIIRYLILHRSGFNDAKSPVLYISEMSRGPFRVTGRTSGLHTANGSPSVPGRLEAIFSIYTGP